MTTPTHCAPRPTTRQNLQDAAPEGYAAQVEVYLLDGTMVVPGTVRRELPWIYFESQEKEDDLLTHRVVAVRPEQIARIEIHYSEGKAPSPGFRVEDAQKSVPSRSWRLASIRRSRPAASSDETSATWLSE